MLFTNRGISPSSVRDSGRFSFNEAMEYDENESAAIDEAYNDDTMYLEGDGAYAEEHSYGTAGIIDESAMMEAIIVQEAEKMSDEQRKDYLNSQEFNSLVEAGVVGKKAVMRLSREADMDRRIHLLCLQMGKEAGDADWEALRKNRIKERQLLNKLYNKYSNRVKRQAQMSQKRLVKLSPRMFDLKKPIR